MKTLIISLYMDNIQGRTRILQNLVVRKFLPEGAVFVQAKTIFDHPASINFIMRNPKPAGIEGIENVILLDIDAIPLSRYSFDFLIDGASRGSLVGNIQRSNHIENNQHVFVAPSVAGLSFKTYAKMGCTSAHPTPRSDVMEEFTWVAEEHKIPVEFLMPLAYDGPPHRFDWEKDTQPYWDLADGMPKYGSGTTFGIQKASEDDSNVPLFYHQFQSSVPGMQEKFWEKCERILNGC